MGRVKRKYVRRPRRTGRTRTVKSRVRRTIRSSVGSLYHTFVRRASLAAQTFTVGTSDTYKAQVYTFKLSDLSDYTDFTTLFDAYRLNWVKMTFTFAGSSSQLNDTYFCNFPLQMLYTVDYDDKGMPASSITGWKELQQYATVKMITASNKAQVTFSKKIYPRVAAEVYNNGLTTAYGEAKRMYIDCDNPDVQHFGFKCIVRVMKVLAAGAELTTSWLTDVQYSVTCKNPR